MIMKIQFKKLVWVKQKNGVFQSANPLCRFTLIDVGERWEVRFFVEIYSIDGFLQRIWGETIDECKQAAQRWFNEQLAQFIETSENPAQ